MTCYAWDEEAVTRRVQRLMAERHGGDDAMAIIDETGVPKKGAKTAGARHQYRGAVGKIENSVMFADLFGPRYTVRGSKLRFPQLCAATE